MQTSEINSSDTAADQQKDGAAAEPLTNVNIESETLLPTPGEIRARFPRAPENDQTVIRGRKTVAKILKREDPRLLLVVGPCSIHDTGAALEYAQRLVELAKKVEDTFYLVMRVYFVKPRTTVGWKGLINDPHLNGSFAIDEGICEARKLLLKITSMGLPTGTEVMEPITPQYLHDLISWTAIGARTAESQMHREISSGISTPVGFKNGTTGDIEVAVNALKSVSEPHHFLGVDQKGRCAVFQTKGNPYGHLVLRGGKRPNYDSVSVALSEEALGAANLPVNIMVDCSHANSLKKPELQPLVMDDCVSQIVEGNKSIVGLMLESNLNGGNQKISDNPQDLEYGVSVTDACIDWQTTEKCVIEASKKLAPVLAKRCNK